MIDIKQQHKLYQRRDFLKVAATFTASLPLISCSQEESTSSGNTGAMANELEPLLVGGLPVTCNLSLPVACAAQVTAMQLQNTLGRKFAYSKYTGWPELKESLMTGRIQAAYMLAPMIMELATKDIPVKIVSLGHRSGAVIMVRTDSNFETFRDLAGKRIAIPNRFAVDYLFLRKMLDQVGLKQEEVEIVEMPPPDMPAALYANAVDAYCTGEPFGAAAEMAGYARPIKMTRDEWPNYICCVLTVREDIIENDRPLVQELVNYVLGAGTWLDEGMANRDKAVELAAGRDFFNQDKKILKYVMENPVDRVTFGDLRLIREEFDELMQLSIEAGTLASAVDFDTYVDESFIRVATPAPIHI